jgi:hypothetical protein
LLETRQKHNCCVRFWDAVVTDKAALANGVAIDYVLDRKDSRHAKRPLLDSLESLLPRHIKWGADKTTDLRIIVENKVHVYVRTCCATEA